MVATLTELQREDVARERRHWVRIARACNNRCAFCLDADAQDGTMVPAGEVEAELQRGRSQGATRLILSGGEASIHPDFLALVRRGKQLGYTHVQTITNGRVFAYRRFAAQAIAAGLDEVTFSLHGHTAALHDGLTGVEGSFDQAVAGIRHAVGSGRLIVSGDVVINRRNLEHLRDVLETFVGLGVREVDLLMVMPFGRASPGAGGDLLVDPEAALEPLQRALEWAERRSMTVWTNRLDPRLLEGREQLIQDPHKLHDEVRGRRRLMADLVAGRPMRCAGERCSHCFIHPLCTAMRGAVAAVRRGVPELLQVDLPGGDDVERHRDLLDRPRAALWVRAADAAEAVAIPGADRAAALWLQLRDPRGLRRVLAAAGIGAPVRLISAGGPLGAAARLAVPEWMAVLERGSAARLAALPARPGTRRLLRAWPAATLREELEHGVPLGELHALGPADGWIDLPPCCTGADDVAYDDPLPLAVLDRDGRVDPDAYVEHFVRYRYRVKSLRCAACRFDGRCRGVPVHRARLDGLAALRPRPAAGER